MSLFRCISKNRFIFAAAFSILGSMSFAQPCYAQFLSDKASVSIDAGAIAHVTRFSYGDQAPGYFAGHAGPVFAMRMAEESSRYGLSVNASLSFLGTTWVYQSYGANIEVYSSPRSSTTKWADLGSTTSQKNSYVTLLLGAGFASYNYAPFFSSSSQGIPTSKSGNAGTALVSRLGGEYHVLLQQPSFWPKRIFIFGAASILSSFSAANSKIFNFEFGLGLPVVTY